MSCDWMPATRLKSRHSPTSSPGRRAATVAPDPTSLDGLCRPVVSASSTHWDTSVQALLSVCAQSDPQGRARIGASTRR